MPNTNSKRFGRIKGQVNSALKDALGNVLTSTYITNVTYDDETMTLYFWSGNTLKYSCVIEADPEDYITAPLTLLGVGYDPEDPETECGVDIIVPSGADVYLYSRDFGQTWRSLSQGTNHFDLYGLTDHISLKIQVDRTTIFTDTTHLHIFVYGNVEAYNNVNSLLSPNFANLTDLTTVVGNGAYCFCGLFEGIGYKGLTRAPLLPATTLSANCYNTMFYNSPDLIKPPRLSATNLAGSCYVSMFEECTGLTQAPLLPATTLVQGCYQYMFYGCTSLNEVRIAATNIPVSNCLYNWLNNVAATGDFYCVNGVSYPSGASGIPSGWQVHDLT